MLDQRSGPDATPPSASCASIRPENLLVAVMSYNRGDQLALAIQSIERNLPATKVMIVDDGSTCPKTVALLNQLAGRHTTLVNRKDNRSVYLGGLHTNMNFVLDAASRDGFDYVFFIQDDQQLVRRVDDRFLAETTAVFRSDPAIATLFPVFMRGFFTRQRIREMFAINAAAGFYHALEERQFGISDVCILNLERVNRCGFRYSDTEGNSAAIAKTLKMKHVYCKNPVLMYTPWPATSRDHPDTIQRFNLGVHPFDYMSDDESSRFAERPITEFPIAEDYLRTVEQLRRPWWYTAIHSQSIKEYNDFVRQKQEAGENY